MRAHEGTEVLAKIREPFFSRTYEKYTSHQNTPYQLEDTNHIGLIRKGNVLYFAHELDAMYFEHGARLHRDLFLMVSVWSTERRPMINTTLPSTGSGFITSSFLKSLCSTPITYKTG